MEEWVARGALRGAVVAVGDRSDLVWSAAVGSTDGRPLSVSDRFLLTSITKTLTAVQVLQLVDQGRLDLARPIAEYLPAFGANGKESITTWHVLTHTSGMDQASNTVERWNPRMTAADHLDQALQARLTFAPGSRLEYCSPPFWVLAELVTRLSGIEYKQHLAREVATPCGMTQTSYELGATGDWAAAYGLDDTRLADQQRQVGYPAGGVVSTAADLVLFGQMLLAGGQAREGARVLSPAAIALARASHTDGVPGDAFGARRGLGFALGGPGSLRSRDTFGHGGASGTYMWIDPQHECVVVFLSANWELDRSVLASVCDSVIATRSGMQASRGPFTTCSM
ncbi:MAG TPA: serine hydrolase domain-containing protein [Chloroflexota bacterium]